MTTFLLVRHGETDAVGKMIAGWQSGWHLNSAGKAQVEQLAQRLSRLPIAAVYTSPLERAVETAEPIAQCHGLNPQLQQQFGEFRFGEWEGKTIEELDGDSEWRRFNAHRSEVRAPGGELILETQARMVAQLRCVREAHPDEAVVVVSHGDPLRAVVAHYMGIPLDLLLRFEISPASVTVIKSGDWDSRVMCVNETGEIPL
jgi:probable phosphoglycerate mutase